MILEKVLFLLICLADDDGPFMHELRGMAGNGRGGVCVTVGEEFLRELIEEVVLKDIHGRKIDGEEKKKGKLSE